MLKVELDVLRYQLRVGDRPVRLERQPMELLILLAQRHGELVSRKEIAAHLWREDVFVDIEQGINNAIRKIRLVLHDDPNEPRFLETVVGKGYRLVGPIVLPTPERNLAAAAAVPIPEMPPVAATAPPPQRRPGRFALTLPAVALLIVSGFAAYGWLRPTSRPPFSLQHIRTRKLTEHGLAEYAGISPDGRYVAYTQSGNRGLWLKQIASGSDIQLVPPQPGRFLDTIFFSASGDYVYFGHSTAENPSVFDLYSIPTLGGAVRHVISDIAGAALSPNGTRIAFVRWDPVQGKTLLMTANQDGSELKEIASRKTHEGFLRETPAWSPNGQMVAAVASRPGNEGQREIVVVPMEGGPPRVLSTERAFGQFAWYTNNGFLAVAFDFSAGFAPDSNRAQIYYQPLPGANAVRFTSDMNHYTTVAVAANGDALVSVDQDFSANVFISPADRPGEMKPVTNQKLAGLEIDWSSSNRLAIVDENLHLYSTDTKGLNRTVLTDFAVQSPRRCGEGALVFERLESNNDVSLWGLNLGDGTRRKLAQGSLAMDATCSPDGQVVYYTSYDVVPVRVMKMALTGGQSEPWGPSASTVPVVSPDGKKLLLQSTEGSGETRRHIIAVMNLSDGTLVRKWPLPPGCVPPCLRPVWFPDGNSFIYSRHGNEIWQQPIGKSPPRLILSLPAPNAVILAYAYSPDGRHLGLILGVENRDVVLFTGFHH